MRRTGRGVRPGFGDLVDGGHDIVCHGLIDHVAGASHAAKRALGYLTVQPGARLLTFRAFDELLPLRSSSPAIGTPTPWPQDILTCEPQRSIAIDP